MVEKKKAVSITVPSKDPKKKDGDDEKKKGGVATTLDGVGGGDGKKTTKKTAKGGSKGVLEPEELSEEDTALKEGLELAVTRVNDKEPGIGESGTCKGGKTTEVDGCVVGKCWSAFSLNVACCTIYCTQFRYFFCHTWSLPEV